jgi:hypothetical protein
MRNLEVGSKEFFEEQRELTVKTYKDKIPQETLDAILALIPEKHGTENELNTPSSSARVDVTAAFIYGTIDCDIDSLKMEFEGTHWGLGLAGFASSGILYTAYYNWNDFFANAVGYHVQCAGAGGGAVQVTWFTAKGVPAGQFMGVAGGAGAMEVGGKGLWSPMK